MKPSREFDWFDKPATRRKLWFLLYGLCGISVLLEVFAHRHGHFAVDGFFGFYAALGFAACALSIFAAKLLGLFLKAKEDYYRDKSS